MMRSGILALGLVCATLGTTWADTKLPRQLKGIGIVDKRGAKLPTELSFVDQTGKTVKLGEYLDGKHPLLLVLAYYQCPMLCSLVLNGVVESARGVPFTIGKDYRVVTVSFDPRDKVQVAAQKRKKYIDALGKKKISGTRPWDFLVEQPGDKASVKKLADTVGFNYAWDARTNQFAHAAGVFLFTADGRLSRVLKGIQYPSRDMRLALVDASEGKLGGAWDKLLLFCYHYDPNDQGYSLAVSHLMRWGGVVMALGVGLWLLRLWRKERNGSG